MCEVNADAVPSILASRDLRSLQPEGRNSYDIKNKEP